MRGLIRKQRVLLLSRKNADRGVRALDVLFLSTHAGRGGTVNYIKALRGRFERSGYVCASAALYSGFDPDVSGVEEILVFREDLPALAYIATVARLLVDVRRRRPAVIVTVMPMANVVAALAGWLSGAAVVVTHHSPHDKNGRVVGLLDKLVGTLGGYTEIVCVSQAVSESFARHPAAYRERLSVIPNGVPPMRVHSARSETLARLGLPDDVPVVYMAGRLAPQKNVLKAVEAVAKVEGARLVLSGDGPLRSEIVTLAQRLGISHRLHLLGLIDRQDMIDLMACCDAFLQVSLYEGQSMSLLEAIHVGAPPVVSDIPVQLEVIRMADGTEAGITCDPTDVEDIARAVRTVLFDAGARAAVLSSVARLAPQIRTEEQMLSDYQRVLRQIVSPQRAEAEPEHAS